MARLARSVTVLMVFAFGAVLLSGSTAAQVTADPAVSTVASTEAVGPLLPSAVVPAVPGFDLPPDKEEANKSIYDSQYRPINRWRDPSVAFFTKYDGFVGTQIVDQAQRVAADGMAMAMAIGNMLSNITSNFTQFAVSFNAIDTLGSSIDDITKQVVKALFTADGAGGAVTTTLITGVMVVLLLSMIWQSVRAGGIALLIRRLAGLVVIFAMVFAMANAAFSSGGKSDANGYHPVPLSPGWVVKTINDSVGKVADAPATLFTNGMQSIAAANSVPGESLSCTNCRSPRREIPAGECSTITEDPAQGKVKRGSAIAAVRPSPR